jgi:hypothetical protein
VVEALITCLLLSNGIYSPARSSAVGAVEISRSAYDGPEGTLDGECSGMRDANRGKAGAPTAVTSVSKSLTK